MLNRKQKLALTTLGFMVLVGCAQPPQSASPTLDPGIRHEAIVANARQGGDRTVSINLVAPDKAAFTNQALVHRWVDNDIFQYEVTLKVFDGTNFVDLTPALTVVVPRKDTPKTKAVFTNLRHGMLYQASVIAKGDNGGTSASTHLTSTPAVATFDFTATQDVEDTLSANLQVVFDQVPFNGTGTATMLTPVDGQYQNPTGAESGIAQ